MLHQPNRLSAAIPSMLALLLGAAASCLAQDVLTYHNDNLRTGQNLTEVFLTPSSVRASTFGKLYTVAMDGKVDAQPLYVSKLAIPGKGTHNVVFAATEHDSVYAFDARNGSIIWRRSLLKSGETTSDARDCEQVVPEIGITSTPVIDRTAGPHGTIYVVAMSKEPGVRYHQRLHALDLATGAEQFGGPVEITASVPGTGDDSSNGAVVFRPGRYKERASLLLAGGVVYTSWSSHCDIRPYTGWVIGYNRLTLARTSVFNFVPNGSEAAVWGSGAGPAEGPGGFLFFATGNGTFDSTSIDARGFPSRGNFGNAFVKLRPVNGKLAVADYWTMFNSVSESNVDLDLGSGGVLLLPDQKNAAGKTVYLGIGGGKDRHIYVFDRSNMGKYDSRANNTLYQELPNALGGPIFGVPAWFDGNVYFGAVRDVIRAFKVRGARLSSTPSSTTALSYGYPGATPSISANGTRNGILWAVENETTAVLHAYDAQNLGNELYHSNQAPGGRDQVGPGNKFVTPTVTNGKVFVATAKGVTVFGLLP